MNGVDPLGPLTFSGTKRATDLTARRKEAPLFDLQARYVDVVTANEVMRLIRHAVAEPERSGEYL